MPFDDDDFKPENKSPGLKNVSSKQSMFDSKPKKHNKADFEGKVSESIERQDTYKYRAAELAAMFKKFMVDKTLPENKNTFAKSLEREVIGKMVQLAIEINNDPDEQEGMGSLGWIVLLLTTILSQRDKINELEFYIEKLDKKINTQLIDKKNSSG